MENEMSSYVKSAFEADARFDQYDRKGTLIDGSSLGGANSVTGFFGTGAIHNNGFKTATGKPSDALFEERAMLDVNFEFAEDAPQDAYRLLVRTQY
jgi:hypothetical protein